jgi:fructan beta-fructosidase
MIRLTNILFLLVIIACTTPAETIPEATKENPDYSEKHRLQFHFSPQANWMNDPNGMVYLDGEYHLFYQYYPDSTVWGPMHWGHAVSNDLVNWEHLPIALYPDTLGYIFSGSAVYDEHNTSGLGTEENPPLVAIYTYHRMEGEKAGEIDYQTQGIAHSIDKGRTWIKFEGNPVLNNPGINDFRDPKVFWMDAKNKWVMSLAVKDHISFYSSPDLINWTLESDFGKDLGGHGGVWECPDLFQLDDKWVLLVSINPGGPNQGSATQYFVGEFDGTTFTPQDDNTRWLDYGRDNYAGVTWSNLPEEDNRKIFLGWMSNWDYAQVVPTEKWRSAMTVPRTLKLSETEKGYEVTSYPVPELNSLHGETFKIETAEAGDVNLNEGNLATYDLELTIDAEEKGPFEIQLYNNLGDTLKLGYNGTDLFYIDRDNSGNNQFSEKFAGRQEGPFTWNNDEVNLRMLVDVGSVEIFLNEGELTMTSLFFPQEPLTQARLVSSSAAPISVAGNLYEMKSIWKSNDN